MMLKKKEIPVFHARNGGYLAGKWQLPADLVDAIRYHHTVSKRAHDPDLMMLVHMADIIVNRFMVDSKDKTDFSEIHPDAFRVLGSQLDSRR